MSEQQALIAGRYKLVELIGRGGMGDVYRGEDTRRQRPVAVKLLHQTIITDNPDIVDRFEREGEALRQLNHPNIVKILDTIEEDDRHYLIMEYVGGGSLRELMDDQSRLPTEAVLNLALDLADALTRAHRLNIIHRDIKPDNVLLAEDGTPRLTDFGVAHLGDRTRLTQTGSVIGTYAYLSPEACNGLELDERTDIWSFGIMLYEMLAGRLPFQENSTAAILTAILTKPAPDLSRLRPDLPDALYDLIYRMLEKDRDQRIPSVRLVGAELEALIRGMDTPLRSLMISMGGDDPNLSRFATPSEQGEVPAMIRTPPDDHTHGFSVYPTPGGTPSYTPPGSTPRHMTPDGMPSSGMVLPGTGEYPPTRNNSWKWIALMVIIPVLACSLVLLVAILRGPIDDDSSSASPTQPVAVEPVAPDEFMVLVANLEPLGADTNNASRFVYDDLVQRLEIDVPFSKARIRQSPEIIISSDQALAAAESNGATVVIWGNYTPTVIEVNVQVGVTSAFDYITMDRRTIEQAANVRIHLTNARTQTIAREVMGVLAVLQGVDGNVYEFMRALAVMAEIDGTGGTVIGDNVATYVHRYFQAFHADTQLSIDNIDRAIDKDATNAFIYALRSIALQKTGQFDAAAHATETAARLAPADWVVPLYLKAISPDTPQDGISYYDAIIEHRPTDWYPYAGRGALYYLIGDFAHASADFEQSIALGPTTNFPYALNALIAIDEGRFQDAIRLIQVILTDFPDPDLYSRIVGATVGGYDMFGPIVSAFVNMSLGRYEQVLDATATGLERSGPLADLMTMQGLAYCNLGEPAAAETAYTKVLDQLSASPSGFVYALRGDVRLKQDDQDGAQADFIAAKDAGLPYLMVAGFASGQIDCTNYFGSASQTTPLPTEAAPTAQPSAALPVIEPVQPGEYMILVAQLESLTGIEQLSGAGRSNIERFVADDLHLTLEETAPFSTIRIRSYPRVITSDEEARAAAEAAGATVIVWGNYTSDLIELNVQVGVTTAFPYLEFDRSILERTANVRVWMTDERRESVAPYVLGVLGVLQNADGNAFETMRTMAILDVIQVQGGEVVGTGVAAQTQRYFSTVLVDPEQALSFISAAIDLEAGNPILYTFRSTANQQLGSIDAARRDAQTALRLGSANWTMPDFLLASVTRDESVLDLFTHAIQLRPDDWFPLFFRGAIYYELVDYIPDAYALARADLEASIALKPNASFPYVYAALLALHEGRMSDAGAAIQTVLDEFPNPTFMERLVNATFGDQAQNPYAVTLSAFASMVLGRHADVMTTVAAGLADFDMLPDLHLIQGVSACALGDFAQAEISLTRAIAFDPQFMVAVLLRGSVYQSRRNLDAATADFDTVEASPQAAALAPFVQAIRSGTLACDTFFRPDTLRMVPDVAEPTQAAAPMEPVGSGQMMVLVAQFEPLGGVQTRDVARFVADNLTRTLEDEIANSVFRTRTISDLITSDEQARAVAEANGAAFVIWGNYTSDYVEVNVQIGVTSAFRYIQFDRELLEKTINVRVRLTNERRQSVAQQVVNSANMLTVADGDEIGFFLSLAVLDGLDTTGGEVIGNSVAAYTHRALALLREDNAGAIEAFSAAIDLDRGNALLYLYRALGYLRAGQSGPLTSDLSTARRLGPQDWTGPMYLALPLIPGPNEIHGISAVIKLRPEDWYPLYTRAVYYYYGSGELELAKADLQRSIELKPSTQLPYFLALLIALREGRIADAQAFGQTIIQEFPDPEVTNRAMQALYGTKGATEFTGVLIAAGTNALLGQYDSVSRSIDPILAPLYWSPLLDRDSDDASALVDLLLMQGLAHCNLGDSPAIPYTMALKLSPDYALLYVLRGEVRADPILAAADFAAARDHAPDPTFEPWIAAAEAGDWTCANLFDYHLSP